MEEITEKDLKSDEVSQITKGEKKQPLGPAQLRQLEAAREARAVVERTFTSIASAQKDRETAKKLHEIPDPPFSEEFAHHFEKEAAKKILSNKDTPIY